MSGRDVSNGNGKTASRLAGGARLNIGTRNTFLTLRFQYVIRRQISPISFFFLQLVFNLMFLLILLDCGVRSILGI